MIGFYDYTVVVTYISLISSIMGMFFAIDGKLPLAVFCLAFSGLCDMFDGKIARTKKNRTDDEKAFGIQIDSLCDIVCFGIFPIILGYQLGMCKIYSLMILAFYGVAGVIRLAYFNVMEEKRQSETSENRKYYQGLPITSMSVIMPLLFMVSVFFPGFRFFSRMPPFCNASGGLPFYPGFPFPQADKPRVGHTGSSCGCGSSFYPSLQRRMVGKI